MPDSFYADFTALLKPGARILDLGCGSGRDIRYFLDRGYEADGLERSPELAALASGMTGKEIFVGDLRTWTPPDPGVKYDAVWASASLLHLTEEDLLLCARHIPRYLTDGAVIFASFKSGVHAGCDELGRYFTDFTDDLLNRLLKENPALSLIGTAFADDAHGRTDFRWANLYLRYTRADPDGIYRITGGASADPGA